MARNMPRQMLTPMARSVQGTESEGGAGGRGVEVKLGIRIRMSGGLVGVN